jgi:ribosomal protein S18 acetylase RimI-like enzyme
MVRKATHNDISAISELYREQFREMAKLIPDFIKEGDQSVGFLEKTISDDVSDILVYENDGIVVGFILLQAKERPDFDFMLPGKYCYIMDVIVTKAHRNKGFGTALMINRWRLLNHLSLIRLLFLTPFILTEVKTRMHAL